MPFTVSHAAVVVPLYHFLRRYFLPSALIIGSIVPDFHYFIPFGIDRPMTHRLSSIFWFSLPLGFLTFLIFHTIIRQPLLHLMPTRFYPKLAHLEAPYALFQRDIFLKIIISLIISAYTHLTWDDANWLGKDIFYSFNNIQFLASAFGLLIMFYWAWKWLQYAQSKPVDFSPIFSRKLKQVWWATLFILPNVTGGISTSLKNVRKFADFLEFWSIPAMGVFGLLLLLMGLHGQYLRRKQAEPIFTEMNVS